VIINFDTVTKCRQLRADRTSEDLMILSYLESRQFPVERYWLQLSIKGVPESLPVQAKEFRKLEASLLMHIDAY